MSRIEIVDGPRAIAVRSEVAGVGLHHRGILLLRHFERADVQRLGDGDFADGEVVLLEGLGLLFFLRLLLPGLLLLLEGVERAHAGIIALLPR